MPPRAGCNEREQVRNAWKKRGGAGEKTKPNSVEMGEVNGSSEFSNMNEQNQKTVIMNKKQVANLEVPKGGRPEEGGRRRRKTLIESRCCARHATQ